MLDVSSCFSLDSKIALSNTAANDNLDPAWKTTDAARINVVAQIIKQLEPSRGDARIKAIRLIETQPEQLQERVEKIEGVISTPTQVAHLQSLIVSAIEQIWLTTPAYKKCIFRDVPENHPRQFVPLGVVANNK